MWYLVRMHLARLSEDNILFVWGYVCVCTSASVPIHACLNLRTSAFACAKQEHLCKSPILYIIAYVCSHSTVECWFSFNLIRTKFATATHPNKWPTAVALCTYVIVGHIFWNELFATFTQLQGMAELQRRRCNWWWDCFQCFQDLQSCKSSTPSQINSLFVFS